MSLVRFRSEAPRKRPYAAACGRFSYICSPSRPCWLRGREIKASPAVVGGYLYGRAKSRFTRLARSSFAGAKLAASQVSLRSANLVELHMRATRRGIRSDRLAFGADEPSLALLDLLGRVLLAQNSQRAKSHCVRLTWSSCTCVQLAAESAATGWHLVRTSQVSLCSTCSVEFCWRKTRRGIRSDRTFQVLSFPIKMEGQSAGLAFHFWCGRQDLNLHGHPPEPKSGASANSATPAENESIIRYSGENRKGRLAFFLAFFVENVYPILCACPAGEARSVGTS